ncbi:MAG: DNA-binding protein WhiA [Thermoleophilia bacterium]
MAFTRDVKLDSTSRFRRLILSAAPTLPASSTARGSSRSAPGPLHAARHLEDAGSVPPLLALLEARRLSAPCARSTGPRTVCATRVILGDEPRAIQLLNEAGVVSDDLRLQMRVPRRLIERRCCLEAFVRGLFLGCGSISAPGAEVHIEFTVEDEAFAEQVRELLARLGLEFKLATRARNVACYSKRSQTGADILATMGAHSACLRWEEHAVLGDVRQSANRRANCDAANARRSAAAGERQAAALRKLMNSPAWSTLSAMQQQVGTLRVEYPYLTLTELAGLTHPRLSKSALNHRLRRLLAQADEL